MMSTKILVVEDSAADRMTIKNMLDGYEVHLACDGDEALHIIETDPDIDMMILDLNMPKLDGFKVLSFLKAVNRHERLLTIILTNYGELEDEINGLQLGSVDYIRKPINMETLKAKIVVHVELLKMQQRLEDKLMDSEVALDTVFREAPIGISISQSNEPYATDNYDIVSLNPAYEQITGRTKEEINKIGWAKITHPDDVKEDLDNFQKLRAGKIKSYALEKRMIRPDGSVIWVYVVVARLPMSKQNKYGYIVLLQDITARKQIECALTESERSKSVLLSNLQGMAYRCNFDHEWTMQFVSTGCYELTGYKPESLLYNKDISFNEIITPEYRTPLWKKWNQILTQRRPFRFEYEIETAKGGRKWVLEIGQGIYNDKGEVEALEGIIIDISDRKGMENALKYNSEHDEWTGLYNRRYLDVILTRELRAKSKKKKALISINLSTMQSLTTRYGFEYSQELTKKVADALKLFCSDGCLLFSTYEYRFAYYVKGYRDRAELSAFCERVSSVLSAMLTVERINAGIGVLEIEEEDSCDIEQMLKSLLITSEEALHLDDEENGICFYNKELKERIIRREILQSKLSVINEDGYDEHLYLQYQPIFDLHENRVIGFEALARYRSHELGAVSPLEFIPIAEETKQIVAMGNSIIHQACAFLSKLSGLGYDSVDMAINISAIQLLSKGFVENLLGKINQMKINPQHIVIELTESIFSSKLDEINKILGRLCEYGMKCSIDDFGTGYSSLSRERELKVSCLKIDKSFIDKLMYLKDEEAITGDIISMAHRLGHSVVAEGVEHEKQLQYLAAHGCDKIQGYLISEPLDEDRAIEFLEKHMG
ncbi:Chemotaxis response regulator protein-glutamate methylesterase [bioreactor metagenome]|uniref:Chemotaxis response regulator protein-glutamate methylesterase n=1 Tax=bioreactor metagenome TaxID=1076179 RepID=A0A644WHL7_9ZZZZ